MRRAILAGALLAALIPGAAAGAEPPQVIAHRGDFTRQPENSLDAIRAAANLGVAVEIDVRYTRDQVPVILHDDTLLRTTGDPRRVADVTFAELRRLCLQPCQSTPDRVPTLWEALRAARSVGAFVELKVGAPSTTAIDRVIGAAIDSGAYRKVVWGSFSAGPLDEAKAAGLRRSWRIKTGAYYGGTVRLSPDAVRARGATAWAFPHYSLVTEAYVAELEAAGLRVATWTVNSASRWDRVFAAGVDAVMTDRTPQILGVAATTRAMQTRP